MNKIYAIIIALLLTTACQEKLDILPIGNLTPNEQMATPEGAEAVLLSAYQDQNLHELWLNSLDIYGDMGMGLSIAIPSWHSAVAGEWPPALSSSLWSRTYPQIARCNFFLSDVNEYDPEFKYPGRREVAIAEARALRAQRYFRLVRCFSDVPLVLDTNMDNWYPERSPEEEVYRQIIDDLTYAVEHLPETPPAGILSNDPQNVEWGRVTKYAAMGLLAKVYMTAPGALRDYQRAATLLEQIINSGRYSLLPNWPDLFNPDFRQGDVNTEMIWPIMFTNSFQGGGTKIAHYSTTSQSWMRPTNEMYEKYEEGDVRRDATILKGWRENFLEKFMQGLSGDERDNHPWYILRYADVLLTYAECLTVLNFEANKTKIVDLLNQVRERANASLAEPDDFPDQKTMIHAILDEVHKELYFEAQYWFAMKRNGMEVTFERQGFDLKDEYKFLLPLPPSALRTNPNLYQNPGYNDE